MQQCRQPATRLAWCQEKNVSKILLIKKKAPAFDKLIKDISKTADDGEKHLDRFAKDNPTLDLHQTRLPPGEVAARRSPVLKRKNIRFSLPRTRRLSSICCSRRCAGRSITDRTSPASQRRNSTIPGEEREFNSLESDLNGLYVQVIAEMRALPRVTDRRDRDNKKKPRT